MLSHRMDTEKEKMLRGEIYDANFDPQLLDERMKCKLACRRHNDLMPDRLDERNGEKPSL